MKPGNAVILCSRDVFIGCGFAHALQLMDRRTLLKAATGAAAQLCASGILGKLYQRALARDDVVAEILAIPGHDAQPTVADMERIGELCLRSTKRSAFAGQTVTFIGLNKRVITTTSPATVPGLGGVHRGNDPVDRCPRRGDVLPDSSRGSPPVRSSLTSWRVELHGKGISSVMAWRLQCRTGCRTGSISGYVSLLRAQVGTWDDVTFRVSIDGDCHSLNYRHDVFSNAELAEEWIASGGDGDRRVPTTGRQVQAQTQFQRKAVRRQQFLWATWTWPNQAAGFNRVLLRESHLSVRQKCRQAQLGSFEPETMIPVRQQLGIRPCPTRYY